MCDLQILSVLVIIRDAIQICESFSLFWDRHKNSSLFGIVGLLIISVFKDIFHFSRDLIFGKYNCSHLKHTVFLKIYYFVLHYKPTLK